MAGDEGPGRGLVGRCAVEDGVDVDEARGPGKRLGRPFTGAGCSTKASRLTSRQPPQVAEMARNSDSIQSAAALMPWPGGRSVSMLESVLRVPKLTSLAMSAWIASGEMVRRAAAMAGSAGAREPGDRRRGSLGLARRAPAKRG